MDGPRFLVAVASIVAAAVSRVSATQCKSSVQMINSSWYNEGGCPVKFTSVPSSSQKTYSEDVTVHVWMRKDDLRKSPRLKILSHPKVTVIPVEMKSPGPQTRKSHKARKKLNEIRVSCSVLQKPLPPGNTTFDLLELVYDCGSIPARKEVSVIYQTTTRSCPGSYVVKAPVPEFTLAVNLSARSFSITAQSDKQVNALWCYRHDANCMSEDGVTPVAIDPSRSPSALVNFHYLLPCVCLQVFYTYRDSPRERKCPFEDQNLADVADVWLSSEVVLFNTHLTWKSKCPASSLNVSAALCWRLHEHQCVVAPNSTLTATGNGHLNYDTSLIDKHPRMCVQFSSRGSRNISCPFLADMSTWEVNVGMGRRSLLLKLSSDVRATFSAQLCIADELRCAPRGETHSLTVEQRPVQNASEMSVAMPADFPQTQLCVQAWRSDPPLHGRRILCMDSARRRSPLYLVLALVLGAVGCLLGCFIHRQVKLGLATWFYIQKPVLLVSSSEQSSHVAATCALASMLEGDLHATVHTALWASTSKSQGGLRTGVADIGPLPWLYGQWEAVRHAQGNVLLVWSPEATAAYEKCRREALAGGVGGGMEENTDKRTKKIKAELKRHIEKSKAGLCPEGHDDEIPEMERTPAVAPAFMAALACLEAALRQGRGQGLALVYFQGLCQGRDVPRALRRIPRYCLPQDFCGLVQELEGSRQAARSEQPACRRGWRCWPRLLSKALSARLAQRLTQRLDKLLGTSDPSSPPRPTSAEPQAGFGSQRDTEHEPLRPTPATTEHTELRSQPFDVGEDLLCGCET